ncbi:hypothetical protein KKG83_07075 [Candidatus Micrarchaeota archaeon]|nr:hypothetical protein [Candidatus Micrarchaeota archaeon]MBU2477205.1 hypothetical protein [Candidatus Micrarchaeota archaeon]
MKEFVMDSAVILNNFNFSFSEEETYFTTNEVLDEMIDLRSRNLIQSGLKEGKIKIKAPKKELIQKIKNTAKQMHIDFKLSEADYSILALAFELKLPLLTDDYHIQKVCLKLGLEFDSVFREKIS